MHILQQFFQQLVKSFFAIFAFMAQSPGNFQTIPTFQCKIRKYADANPVILYVLGAVYMSPVCRDETLDGLKVRKRNLTAKRSQA
jgi:hypothetical protein